MRSKYSYIIFYLLSLYCNIGANAKTSPRPAVRACEEIKKNYKYALGNYVTGGKKAELGEFPHMVGLILELSKGNKLYCGGSLISPTYVLTAAHCLNEKIPNVTIIVHAGSIDIGNAKFDPNTDIRAVEKIIHPQYNSSQHYDDIALLRLPKPVKITANVSPICLETNDANPKRQLVVTGWGTTKSGGDISRVLLKAYVKAISQADCNVYYNKNSASEIPKGIIKKQLCAYDPTGHQQDTCQGDSGGPLIVAANEGRSRLVGITSFGLGCGIYPGVYTRVASYLDWIERIVWPYYG